MWDKKEDSAKGNLERLLLSRSSTEIPKFLYHYTDAQGCQGIMQSKEIRLTNSEYLNDHREFLHTRDLMLHRLRHVADTAPSPDERELANFFGTGILAEARAGTCSRCRMPGTN